VPTGRGADSASGHLSESDANTKAFVDLDNLERDLNVWLGRASEYRAWLATQRRDWPTMGQGI
jgi:hypothetical protein